MLRLLAIGLLASFVLQTASESRAQPALPEAPGAGREILEEITRKVRSFEAEYTGSFTRRTVATRVYDPDDGTLRSRKDFVVDVWTLRGEHPRNEVQECRVDGEPAALEECEDEPRGEPMHEIFADDAAQHYRLEYGGLADWRGDRCHRVRVIPLEETSRHIRGDLFFLEETLRLAGSTATLASYPFGLKDFSIEMTFAGQGNFPVLAGGRSDMRIKVPLLFDARIVSEFTATDQRLLTRAADAASATPLSRVADSRSAPPAR